MKARKRASSSTLFLMELILAILFFCIAAAICVYVFAMSHVIHLGSVEQDNAVKITQNISEILRSSKDKEDLVQGLTTTFNISGEVNLNDDIIIKESGLTTTLISSYNQGLLSLDITVTAGDGQEIYTILIEHFLEKEVKS